MPAAPAPSAAASSDLSDPSDLAGDIAAADPAWSGAHRTPVARMDRAFVARHQIVERYLSGRLPRKGAQDFEQFCREHPELLEEIGLAGHLHAALRLLEAGGQAPPWEEKPARWWQRPPALIGAVGLCVLLGMLTLILLGRLSAAQRTAAALRVVLATQPLDPAESTRTITLIPSRTAPSQQSLASIGGSAAEFADLRIDMGWSSFAGYQVIIDRVDQGRVAVLRGLTRDSNGDLRIGLNSSALGPGQYQLTIDGLNWRGEPVAQAWASITVARGGAPP